MLYHLLNPRNLMLDIQASSSVGTNISILWIIAALPGPRWFPLPVTKVHIGDFVGSAGARNWLPCICLNLNACRCINSLIASARLVILGCSEKLLVEELLSAHPLGRCEIVKLYDPILHKLYCSLVNFQPFYPYQEKSTVVSYSACKQGLAPLSFVKVGMANAKPHGWR